MHPAHTSRNSVGHTNQAHTEEGNHTEQVGRTQWGREELPINSLHGFVLKTHPTQTLNTPVPRRTSAVCVYTHPHPHPYPTHTGGADVYQGCGNLCYRHRA